MTGPLPATVVCVDQHNNQQMRTALRGERVLRKSE